MRRNTANLNLSELIERWGNSTSIALFDPKTSLFSMPLVEGLIGYRSVANCIVVLGDPVCAAHNRSLLTGAFFNHCQQQAKTIIYAFVSSHFKQCIKSHHAACSIQVVDEIILNPLIDIKEQTGADARRLRNKYNQAVRESIIIREYTGNNPSLEFSFERLMVEWLQGRKGPQIFQQHINLFENRQNKRWVYAKHNKSIVGLIILTKIPQGWVLNMAMMGAQAPRYLSEAMFLAVLDILRNEGCEYFTLGALPSAQLGAVDGVGAVSEKIAQTIFKMAHKVLNLGQSRKYWKKFNPRTEPMYVVFSGSKIKLTAIAALFRSFNLRI